MIRKTNDSKRDKIVTLKTLQSKWMQEHENSKTVKSTSSLSPVTRNSSAALDSSEILTSNWHNLQVSKPTLAKLAAESLVSNRQFGASQSIMKTELDCGVCESVMRDPQLIIPCGHTFCYSVS